MTASPFGRYAAVVAAAAALFVLGGWVATALHLFGAVDSGQLDTAALVILGAIFGTGAGALTVTNGLGKQLDAANTRLDAIGAPTAQVASAAATVAAASPPPVLFPPQPPAAPPVGPPSG
jgi:hypothetical protein